MYAFQKFRFPTLYFDVNEFLIQALYISLEFRIYEII